MEIVRFAETVSNILSMKLRSSRPYMLAAQRAATHQHQSSNIMTRIVSNTPISRHRVVHECSVFEKCSRLSTRSI
jgi:hypothetical protein